MDWKMEVYSPGLELLGILEEYDSVMVDEWAFKPGSFTIQSVMNEKTRPLLQPDNIVWIGDDMAGVIEFVQASASTKGQTLSVKGSLLLGLLSRRVLWGQYNLYDYPEHTMHEVVTDCAISPTRGSIAQRIIPGLIINSEPKEGPRKVRKQSTGDTLTDFLTEMGQANLVAHGVRFNAAIPQMEFWTRTGVDRTINQTAIDPVLYSTELDDVLSSEYSFDSSEYRNVALVAGEGEGVDRKSETVVGNYEGSVLPKGYTRLEYIETTYGQYFDTKVTPNDRSRVIMDFQVMSGNLSTIFGVRTGNSNGFFAYSDNGLITIMYGTQYLSMGNAKEIPSKRAIIDFNGPEATWDSTKVQFVQQEFSCESTLTFSCLNDSGSQSIYGGIRIYSSMIYSEGELVRSYIPCKDPSGAIGLYDSVNKEFILSLGFGTISAGPVYSKLEEPSGFCRREAYVDARDLQSNSDPNNPMTDEEYTSVLGTRGEERLAESQLVQSFSATVRTMDPTYEYGVDFFLGDTITVTDERLGVSVNAVVEGVEHSLGKNGEDLVLTLGYSLPTISDKLRKAGV